MPLHLVVVSLMGYLHMMLDYIIVLTEFFGKKANLHLPLLNIFAGCAMLGLCTLCCYFVYVVSI